MSKNEKQAETLVESELFNAKLFLTELHKPLTPENVLSAFSLRIKAMLTEHFDLMDTMIEGTNNREVQLLGWLKEVKLMMDAIALYQQEKNKKFLDDATRKFIENYKYIIKPSIN